MKLEEYVDRLLDNPANTETLGHEPQGCKPGTKRPRTLTTEVRLPCQAPSDTSTQALLRLRQQDMICENNIILYIVR